MFIEVPLSILIIILLVIFWLAYDSGRLQKKNKELKSTRDREGEQ